MFASLFRRTAARPAFAGPPGERLYAVGDIHGRLDLLDRMLGLIVEDLELRAVDAAQLAFLGDYVDRGPDAAGVIARLIDLAETRVVTRFVMGNHEEMLLRVLADEPGTVSDWLAFGGDRSAESYGLTATELATLDEIEIAARLRAAMPPAHRAFLENLDPSARFGDFLLVHAGIRPGVPLDEQRPADLRWIRRPFLTDRRDHGAMVIHGHTVTRDVDLRPNRIGIDTGAYATGVLTAAVVEDADVRFLQTGPDPDASLATSVPFRDGS